MTTGTAQEKHGYCLRRVTPDSLSPPWQKGKEGRGKAGPKTLQRLPEGGVQRKEMQSDLSETKSVTPKGDRKTWGYSASRREGLGCPQQHLRHTLEGLACSRGPQGKNLGSMGASDCKQDFSLPCHRRERCFVR